MSIRKTLIGTAIVLSGGVNHNAKILSDKEQPNLETTPNTEVSYNTPPATLAKRTPQKVYHKFSEIPSISDAEASLYNRSEYTYIIDATTYQKTGKITLKRVLTAETPSLNILSPTYCRECDARTPKPGEDPKATYDLNPARINSQGYKGPTQMNDASVTAFMKYLLANPKTRAYVVNLFQTSDKSSVHVAAANLEKLFFASNGTPLPIDKCAGIHTTKTYTNLKIKGNVTDAYKKLIASMPKKKYLAELEKYQLRFFGIGRIGKPQEIIEAVAKRMNYKNATHVSMYVMGAAYCHVNWKGNGTKALSDAETKKNPNSLAVAKSWVSGKGVNGVIDLSEQTIITPQIIAQFQQMGISGAEELNSLYQQAVTAQEKRKQINQQKRKTQKKTAENNKKTFMLQAYMLKQRS